MGGCRSDSSHVRKERKNFVSFFLVIGYEKFLRLRQSLSSGNSGIDGGA